MSKIRKPNFILSSFALLLFLISLNAWSGTSELKIRKGWFPNKDPDTYVVTAMSNSEVRSEMENVPNNQCIKFVRPWILETSSKLGEAVVMQIEYESLKFDPDNGMPCGINASIQYFRVQSKNHPERVAYFSWWKSPNSAPFMKILWLFPMGETKFDLIHVDSNFKDNSTVWIGLMESNDDWGYPAVMEVP